MADWWNTFNFSCIYRDQSGWGIPAAEGTKSSDWDAIRCTFPEISLDRETEDMNLATGQVGAEDAPVVGKRSGTVTFSTPLTSQASGYDATSGPALTELTTLIAWFLGGHVIGAYDVDDVDAASTANLVKTVSGTYKPGSCYAFGDATDSHAIDAVGWVQSQSVQDLTMFEDMRAIPVSGDESYGMITFYPDTSSAPTPKTFRILGTDSDHDWRFVDFLITSMTIRFEAGMVPKVDITGMFSDCHLVEGDGGLVTVPSDIEVPNIGGDNNGRVLLGSNYVSAYDDGTAVPVGLCGLSDMSLEIEAQLTSLPCHSGRQGNGPKRYAGYTCRLRFSAPFTQEDLTDLSEERDESDYTAVQTKLEHAFTNAERISATGEVGRVAGELFAFRIPSGGIVEQPQPSVNENLIQFSAVLGAMTYSSDGSSSDAGNKAFAIALG